MLQNIVPLQVGPCEIVNEDISIGSKGSACDLGKEEAKEELAQQQIVQIEHIDCRNHKDQRECHCSEDRHFCF